MAPRTQPTEPGPGKSGLPPTGVPVPRPAADTATGPPTEHKLSSLYATKLPRNALRPAPLFDEKSGGEPSPPQDAERCYFDTCAGDLDPRAGDLGRQAGGYRPPCGTAKATTPFRDTGSSERAASVGCDPGPTGRPGVGTSSAGGRCRSDAETLGRAQFRTAPGAAAGAGSAREALGRYANRGAHRPGAGAAARRAYRR